MQLLFHGGKCCGIKIIYGFGERPTDMADAEVKKPLTNKDEYGYEVSSSFPFFTDDAPYENYEHSLSRLISFCKRRRPQGIIEVTLADGSRIKQTAMWGDILKGHGFKCVTTGTNSNTQNVVSIYHLVYDEVY